LMKLAARVLGELRAANVWGSRAGLYIPSRFLSTIEATSGVLLEYGMKEIAGYLKDKEL